MVNWHRQRPGNVKCFMFDKSSQQNIRIIHDFISPGESTLSWGKSTLGPGESTFFFRWIDSEIGQNVFRRMGHRAKRPQFQSPNLFHTFTIHFALTPVVLHPQQNGASDLEMVYLALLASKAWIIFLDLWCAKVQNIPLLQSQNYIWKQLAFLNRSTIEIVRGNSKKNFRLPV